jgi:hypothetical protein
VHWSPRYCAPGDAFQWQAIVRRLLFTILLTEYATETVFSLSLLRPAQCVSLKAGSKQARISRINLCNYIFHEG